MKNFLRQTARPLGIIATAASCFFSAACGDVGQKQATVTTDDTAETSVASPDRPKPPIISGPRIVSDSLVARPGVQITRGEFVVQLPPAMSRLLFDSLTGFSPFPTSAYDSTVWASEQERDTTAILPSVVLGDFDGDGHSDVAMVGASHDSAAAVIITGASGHGGPHLLFMSRPHPADRFGKTDVLLRAMNKQVMRDQYKVGADGVEEEYIGKGATIFYVENGTLRQIQTGDD